MRCVLYRIGLKGAQSVIHLVTIFFAYLLTIAPAGYFRAWVAAKMGDETAKNNGFLTLNPINHIDPIGIIMLFLFNIGWGKQVPINIANIREPNRLFKFSVALLSGVFIHFLMAIIALFVFILLLGGDSFALIHSTVSSLAVSIARIIITFIYLNIFLAVIELVVNIILIGTVFFSEKYSHYQQYTYYILLIVPIVVLLLFGGYLGQLLMYGVLYLGNVLARLFGG